MELIDVYRVETETGAGPYMGAHVSLTHGGYPDIFTNHPGPDDDKALMQGPPTARQADTDEWAAYSDDPGWDEEEGQHPTIGIHSDERCGFWSLAQLRQWFDVANNLSILDKAGHGITHYRVPANELRYGVRQIVFTRREAVKVGRIGILDALATQ